MFVLWSQHGHHLEQVQHCQQLCLWSLDCIWLNKGLPYVAGFAFCFPAPNTYKQKYPLSEFEQLWFKSVFSQFAVNLWRSLGSQNYWRFSESGKALSPTYQFRGFGPWVGWGPWAQSFKVFEIFENFETLKLWNFWLQGQQTCAFIGAVAPRPTNLCWRIQTKPLIWDNMVWRC